MKKVLQIIAAALLSVVSMGSFASAASCDGSITLTGPGSNNIISCKDVTNVNVKCTNNIYIADVNYQNGNSGGATVGDNTSAGTAVSGNVTNSNGQNVQLGASCGQAAAPAVAGGGGAVSAAAAPAPGAGSFAPPQSPAPGKGAAMLPNTASNSLATTVIGSLIAAAGVLGASRLGIATYRRYGLK